MICVFTGRPTNHNFKGTPVHPDALEAARNIRDRTGAVSLRYILANWQQFRHDILKVMAAKNETWQAEAYPNTYVKTKKLVGGKLITPQDLEKEKQNKRFIAPHTPLLDK